VNRRDAIKAAVAGVATCALPAVAATQPIVTAITAWPKVKGGPFCCVTFDMSDGTQLLGECEGASVPSMAAFRRLEPMLGMEAGDASAFYARLRG
jgi:hypothetical protein